MIVNFYIEVEDDEDQVNLERYLNKGGYAFLDATNNDPYTRHPYTRQGVHSMNFPTLESIEADLECK